MATLRINPAGAVIAVLGNGTVESLNSTAPVGTTTFQFDETTNPSLAATISADMANHTVVGGQLRRNGTVVVVAPDGPERSDRNGVSQAATAALAANSAFIALASPSNAQVIAQAKELSRQNNALIRRMVQLKG